MISSVSSSFTLAVVGERRILSFLFAMVGTVVHEWVGSVFFFTPHGQIHKILMFCLWNDRIPVHLVTHGAGYCPRLRRPAYEDDALRSCPRLPASFDSKSWLLPLRRFPPRLNGRYSITFRVEKIFPSQRLRRRQVIIKKMITCKCRLRWWTPSLSATKPNPKYFHTTQNKNLRSR